MRTVLLCCSLALASGCGGMSAPPMDLPDASTLPDLATAPPDLVMPIDPASHPAPPTVDNGGGKVLAAPEVWTVVWPGDEAAATTLDTFHAVMLTSSYWTDSLAEYGVGAGVAKGPIVLPTAAPANLTDSDFEKLVEGLAAMPMYAATPNSLFAILVPVTSSVDDGTGSIGCQDYDGYHNSTLHHYAYTVELNCTGSFDDLTITDSHELAEASTNPYPNHQVAWASNDFVSVSGGEVGDLCDSLDATVSANGVDYTVTRLYSNVAAMAGNDPCVPAPANPPYFGAALNPSLVDLNTGNDGTGSATATIDLFALGPVGEIDWHVEGLPAGMKVVPSAGNGFAGDRIPITIHANALTQSGDNPFDLRVSSAKGGDNQWWVVVTVD